MLLTRTIETADARANVKTAITSLQAQIQRQKARGDTAATNPYLAQLQRELEQRKKQLENLPETASVEEAGWWENLSNRLKHLYIKEHPNSKYAKESIKTDKPKDTPAPRSIKRSRGQENDAAEAIKQDLVRVSGQIKKMFKEGKTSEDPAVRKLIDQQKTRQRQLTELVGASVNTAAVELSADWWESLSPEQKRQYIKDHPNSKYAKEAIKNKPAGKTAPAAKKTAPATTDHAAAAAKHGADLAAHVKKHRKDMDAYNDLLDRYEAATGRTKKNLENQLWEMEQDPVIKKALDLRDAKKEAEKKAAAAPKPAAKTAPAKKAAKSREQTIKDLGDAISDIRDQLAGARDPAHKRQLQEELTRTVKSYKEAKGESAPSPAAKKTAKPKTIDEAVKAAPKTFDKGSAEKWLKDNFSGYVAMTDNGPTIHTTPAEMKKLVQSFEREGIEGYDIAGTRVFNSGDVRYLINLQSGSVSIRKVPANAAPAPAAKSPTKKHPRHYSPPKDESDEQRADRLENMTREDFPANPTDDDIRRLQSDMKKALPDPETKARLEGWIKDARTMRKLY